MWEILCFIFTQVKPFLKKINLPVCSFFFAIRKVYVGFHFPWALKKKNFTVSSVGRLKVSAIFSRVVVGIERFEERALSSFVPTWSNSRRWLACSFPSSYVIHHHFGKPFPLTIFLVSLFFRSRLLPVKGIKSSFSKSWDQLLRKVII